MDTFVAPTALESRPSDPCVAVLRRYEHLRPIAALIVPSPASSRQWRHFAHETNAKCGPSSPQALGVAGLRLLKPDRAPLIRSLVDRLLQSIINGNSYADEDEGCDMY